MRTGGRDCEMLEDGASDIVSDRVTSSLRRIDASLKPSPRHHLGLKTPLIGCITHSTSRRRVLMSLLFSPRFVAYLENMHPVMPERWCAAWCLFGMRPG